MSSDLSYLAKSPYPSMINMELVCMHIISQEIPKRITSKWFGKFGMGESSGYSLFMAFKWWGAADQDGNVIKPDLLRRMGNPDTRRDAFREIVDTSYADVLVAVDIKTATVKDLAQFYTSHGMPESVSGRAARTLLWLCEQAGLEVGDSVQPQIKSNTAKPNLLPNVPPQSFENEPSEGSVSMQVTNAEAPEKAQSDVDDLDLDFARYLMGELKAQRLELKPDNLRIVQEAIDRAKGRNVSNTS